MPDIYVFRCINGHTLRNIRELEAELKNISEDDYKYHVNSQKNDFTNWVKDIVKDEILAKNLLRSTSRAQASRQATSRLHDLSKLLV